MENRSRRQIFLDCAESGFAPFEYTRRVESAGDGVRLFRNADQWGQSFLWGRSGTGNYEQLHSRGNRSSVFTVIAIIVIIIIMAQPRFEILTQGVHDWPTFDQIMILGVDERFK